MLKTLKSIVVSGVLAISALPIFNLGMQASAESGSIFANGNNAYSGNPSSATRDASWDAALDTTGLNGSSTNVIGAKITIYTIDEGTSNELKGKSRGEGKQIINKYLQRSDIGPIKFGYDTFTFTVFKTGYENYITYNEPYYPGSNASWRINGGNDWYKYDSDGSLIWGGQTLSNMRIPDYGINDVLYNTTIWEINSNNFWFAGSNGTLPEAVSNEVVRVSAEMKAKNKISSGSYVVWFIEPLVAVELKGTNDSWYNGVAVTPSMAANLYDKGKCNGIRDWLERYIKLTGTDGLAGGNSYVKNGQVGFINQNGYGAYAVVVEPEDLVVHDTLPEVPSVPVFQKTNNKMEYMGLSSTVPASTWNEITTVLSYAMKLTNTEPNSGLYSYCSPQVADMRQYADSVYDDSGNYDSRYKSYYQALWKAICNYYSSTSITLEADKANIPVRNSNTQPSSCTAKFGGSNGPFKVDIPLGGVSKSNIDLSYKSAKVYKLNGSTSVVNKSATSESSLGSVQGTAATSIKVGDILKNPYAYSIVIESEGTLGGGNYPEPPNIVIWDEKTDKTWEASIANSDWNKIIKALKYARNDGVDSNPSGVTSGANEAREAAKYLQGVSVNDYNTWTHELKQRKEELASIQQFQTTLGSAIDELNEYLVGSFLYEQNPAIFTLYKGNIVECACSNYSRYANYTKYGMYNLTRDSSFARTDIFAANVQFQNLTAKGNILNWYATYKDYMYNHYYTEEMDNRIYTVNIYNEGKYTTSVFPKFNYTNYNITVHPNDWKPRYTMPVSLNPLLNIVNSNSPRSAFFDYVCCTYIEAQRNAYTDLLNNHLPGAISDVQSEIDELQRKVSEYEKYVAQFKTNYETFSTTLMQSFKNKMLVSGTKNGSNVANNVTELLCKRTGGNAFDGMSQKYKYLIWKLSNGNPRQASIVEATDMNLYSAYKNGASYTIGPIGNAIKGELDKLYEDGRNNLDFKYRVVYTGNATDTMTRDTIKKYKNSSCGYVLSYTDVLSKPYSYGIIINSYELDTDTTEIKEWQLSRRMQKTDLDNSSIWQWQNANKTFDFVPASSTMQIANTRYSNKTIQWITGRKTGVSGPALSTKKTYLGNMYVNSTGLSSAITSGETGWNQSNYTETALYKITGSWGGNSGTMEILTEEITAKAVYRPAGHIAAVESGTSKFKYNHNSGSNFDLWREGGSVEIKADFPMMAASNSATFSAVDKPVKQEGPIYKLNTANGYAPAWCSSPVTHTLSTPYYVKVSYHSNSKIRTTFSTDREDTDDMRKYLNNGMIVPYLKAGQTFEGEITNNYIILDGYCNVPSNTDYVASNNLIYKTADDFRNYMTGIANQLSTCNVKVISTINGFNVDSDNNPVVASSPFDVSHSKTSKIDNDAGVVFDEACSSKLGINHVVTNTESVYGNKFRPYGGNNVSPILGNTLSDRTWSVYNNELFNLGEGTDDWYWEYSEALGLIHYQLKVEFKDFKFNATISRYESDSNSEPDEYLKEQQSTLKDAWANSFGYDTYLGKTNDEYTNVVCTAIDLSGLTGDARALFTQDDGTEIQAILGRQTPIHIRGSVYDNT